MKIALIHYSVPPVIGGVETVISQQARLLAAAGHEVLILCAHGGAGMRGCRIVRYPPGASDQALLRLLLHELAGQTLVLMHNVVTMPFDPALTRCLWHAAAALLDVRFVAWIHDIAACNPDYPARAWGLLGEANPRFEYVAISALRARQWKKLSGLANDRCRVIPNGICPAGILGLSDDLAAWESKHTLLDRDFVLLHPARMLRRKNIELGLRVTAAIKATGRTCAYLVTAPCDPHQSKSAAYAMETRQLQCELGLELDAFFVSDHFPVTDRELPQLFTVADALFFPSRQEGFGLPVLEAALHRLPIFHADIEPLRSLAIPGATRFPLDADPAQIAALLMRQLDASPAIQARKTVIRESAWPVVYRKFLAPLLKETVTPVAHETCPR